MLMKCDRKFIQQKSCQMNNSHWSFLCISESMLGGDGKMWKKKASTLKNFWIPFFPNGKFWEVITCMSEEKNAHRFQRFQERAPPPSCALGLMLRDRNNFPRIIKFFPTIFDCDSKRKSFDTWICCSSMWNLKFFKYFVRFWIFCLILLFQLCKINFNFTLKTTEA